MIGLPQKPRLVLCGKITSRWFHLLIHEECVFFVFDPVRREKYYRNLYLPPRNISSPSIF